jgi:hypothetical protein
LAQRECAKMDEMRTTSRKSRAETVFEQYLSTHGLRWEYETFTGRKKPDYLIPFANGKCVVEVKQINDPDPLPIRGFNPDRPVRSKIHSARKQLGEYKDLPCGVAIYTESIFGPSEPGVILAGTFGPGYEQAGRDYSRMDPNPPFYRFLRRSALPEDRHFLANAVLSPVANTTVSALVMLAHYELSDLHLEVFKRLFAKQESGQTVPVDDQFSLLNELGPEFGNSRRFAGTVRVIVIENRYAAYP